MRSAPPVPRFAVMRTLPALLIGSLLLVGTSVPTAAHAASTTVSDPAGDGAHGPRLDMTSGTLDNRAKAVKIRVEVEKVAKGDLFVYLKLKGHRRYQLVSSYDPKQGTVDNILTGGPGGVDALQFCPRLSAAWSTSADTISIRVPAACLADGDYDRARFKLFTEGPGGADTDFAPGSDFDSWSWSAFVPRG
jgi:hypothetical protein